MVTITGKRIAFTGELMNYSRIEAADLVRRAGAIPCTTIDHDTAYLVVGVAWIGSKLDRARAMGIPTIDQAEMLALIAQVN